MSRARRPARSAAIIVVPEPPNKSRMISRLFDELADGALDQFDRLHRRVQIILHRLVDEPDVALVACAAPIMIGSVLPTVQDRLVLALIIRSTERERYSLPR